MKNSRVLKTILFLVGLSLIVMGIWRVTNPVGFYAFSGIILGGDISNLNEARAAGGAIVGFGLLILSGAFNRKLSYTSTIIAMALFYSYGIARVFSLVVDGYPGDMLIQGIVGEFVLGSLAAFAFFKYRET